MRMITKKGILRLLFLIACCALAQAQDATPQKPALADLARLFDYDQKAPLDVQEESVETVDGVRLKRITYVSPKGGRVPAFLVMPVVSKGKLPAILYGHWGNGTHSEFLPEALAYAKAGAVSLLIAYPWVRPAAWHKPGFIFADPEANRDNYVQAVIDLRRGLDLLASLAEVDSNRLAYVGHSYGAQWGAILAAIDKRPKTCVFVGGTPDYAAIWVENDDPEIIDFRKNAPKEQFDKFLQTLDVLNAIHYIPHAAPVSLLFQFARYEQYFKETAMQRYFRAASEPKTVRWYHAGHDLNGLDTLADRAEWLRKQIGVNALPALEQALKKRL